MSNTTFCRARSGLYFPHENERPWRIQTVLSFSLIWYERNFVAEGSLRRYYVEVRLKNSKGIPAMRLGRHSVYVFQYNSQQWQGWHRKAIFSTKDHACFHAPLLVCCTNQSTCDLKWNSLEGYAHKRLIRSSEGHAPTASPFTRDRILCLSALTSFGVRNSASKTEYGRVNMRETLP